MSLLRVHPLWVGCLLATLTWGCGGQQGGGSASSPKAAVAAALRAIDQRDGQSIRQLFSAEAPQAYVEGLAALLAESGRLQSAAASRFGREDAKALAGNAGPGGDDWRLFEQGQEKIEGDHATLTAPDGRMLTFRKEAGGWKIVGEKGSIDMTRAGQLMKELADALGAMARDIQAGKYKEVKEVRAEMGRSVERIFASADLSAQARG